MHVPPELIQTTPAAGVHCRTYPDKDWIRSVFCRVLLALRHCYTAAVGRGVILHRDSKLENDRPTVSCHAKHGRDRVLMTFGMLGCNPVPLTADGAVRVSGFGLAKPMWGQIFATSAVGLSGLYVNVTVYAADSDFDLTNLSDRRRRLSSFRPRQVAHLDHCFVGCITAERGGTIAPQL